MRVRAATTAVLGLLAVATPSAGALERGESEFWNTGASCGAGCWEHRLEVAPHGWRLRVGLDKHTTADGWTAEITGPDDRVTVEVPTGLYSGEAFVDRPAAGPWIVRAMAAPDATDLRFRMRARLEREPPAVSPPVPELPNLQAMPPWDLTFDYPLTNGTSDPPQGMALPGGRLACHLEEVLQARVTRCLRMAFGVRNTGRGPMDLMLGPGEDPADRPLIQQVHHSDGSVTDRPAGTARFHASHGHYHHDSAIALELFALGADNALTPAAELHMKGFAHRDELLREWRMFHPTREWDGFGLSAGWADYYEWDRPGNYIDFGANGDGRYVLRLTADPVGGILESNEQDNVGYSVVQVSGTDVTLLESGRGSGPGDRCRILMPLGPEPDLPPGVTPHQRPGDCPPDTVDPDPALSPVTNAPPAGRAPSVTGKRKSAARRCPKLRRGLSRSRRAKIVRCRRAAAKRRRAAAKRRPG